MKQKIKYILSILRFLPICPGIKWSDEKFTKDVARWQEICHINGSRNTVVATLLFSYTEFRNLFLFRNRHRFMYCLWVKLFYKPMDTLFLQAGSIGGGLFIHHGFATMVSAKSIGENCWINQQVTIGWKDNTSPPVIGNNVTITCGAKVLGNITVGDGAVIGANAVVVKDVKPGAVRVGVPAKRIK